MPIDPSISLRVGQGVTPSKSPLEMYGRILGIQGQQQEQQLNQQSIEQNRLNMEKSAKAARDAEAAAARDAQEEEAIHQALEQTGYDIRKALPSIAKTVRVGTYLTYKKQADDEEKAAHDLAKLDPEALKRREYRDSRLAELTATAMGLSDAEYLQRWGEIAGSAKQIDPELQIPEQPIPKEQLRLLGARFGVGAVLSKKALEAANLRGSEADASKKEADARVAVATEGGRIAQEVVDPQTGLTPGQQTADMKEWQAAVGRGETDTSLTEWIKARANDRKPVTNVTVNGREQFKDESQLRGEFQGLPIVKAYNEIKTQTERARGAYELAKQAEKEGKSASSSDQVIITVLNKVLDPESVVRESEYARTAAGQSALSRLSGYLDKMKRGGAGISSAERASIMETIESLSGATEKEYRPLEQRYRGLAGEYGFTPDRVVPKSAAAPDTLPGGITIEEIDAEIARRKKK